MELDLLKKNLSIFYEKTYLDILNADLVKIIENMTCEKIIQFIKHTAKSSKKS